MFLNITNNYRGVTRGGAAGVSAPGVDLRRAPNEVYISAVENVAREHYRVILLYTSGVFLRISLLSPPEMVPLHKKIISEKSLLQSNTRVPTGP